MPPRSTPPPLDVLQRWMQAVIMHPAGAAHGLDSEAARREIDVTAADIESVVVRSQAQTSLERLDIYANAYFARLMECLRADYPMFKRAVGEEAFDQLAVGYLQQHPSRSYTLNRLGENFPRYLDDTRPPADAATGDWPRLLVELARLERTISEVFDGPGLEGITEEGFAALDELPPEEFGQVRLVPSPALRLLAFEFPVNNYWQSLRSDASPPPPSPERTWLALSRVNYVVRRHNLSEPEFLLLAAIQRGATVVEALQQTAEVVPFHPDKFASQLPGWFAAWRRGRLLAGWKRTV